MSDTTLIAQTGRSTGSAASRRLRVEDRIPGVLYGQGMSPITLSVARRDLRLALAGPSGSNTLLKLSVDGSTYPAIVKSMQRHPVRRNVSHIDFLQVNLKEDVTIDVPLRLEGEAKAVVNEGGLVDPSVDTIQVTCTPGNMPAEFVIDITDLVPGDVVRLADVPMPKGVVATGDPDMPVVTTMMSRAAVAAADATDESAGEGGGDAAEAAGD